MNQPSFADLALPTGLVQKLGQQQIVTPSPIQAAVIPAALEGRHVLGRARTGSGKTLAFSLPVLVRLAGRSSRPKAPRAVILLPTRELALQVADTLMPLAQKMGLKHTVVYGGVPINKQINVLKGQIDVVIATPGRLTDLLDRRCVTLDDVEITVLDEADHLCDLGFFKPIDALLSRTPADSQRLLLSATLDGDVDKLVRKHLPQHVLLEVDQVEDQVSTMEHHVLVTEHTDRIATTHALVSANPRSIVFTRTRRGATRLARQLTQRGVPAVDLHGDLEQRQRERNLRRFDSGEASVVVATDVAARGIHIDGIGLVVHYDAPAEHKAFLHRSGRTARAGEAGSVVTMATPETLADVVKLQAKAGVTARHHQAATAPSPLTVEALATSGTEAPAARPQRQGGQRSGGQRSGQRQGGRPQGQGSGQPRNRRRRGGRGRGAQGQGQGRPTPR